MNSKELEAFWSARYDENRTGWDIGSVSTPIKEYVDQLENKELKILIPGAGNAYEAEYLFRNGFRNIFVLDISKRPLQALKERMPSFPEEQLLNGNFFEQTGEFDLLLEQTFFCSFEPTIDNRTQYGIKAGELLKPAGKLVGLWFMHPLFEGAKRPFGGTRDEYLGYLEPHFNSKIFEVCYNSIPSRMGKELFGIFEKK